jgi:hypothetical protein
MLLRVGEGFGSVVAQSVMRAFVRVDEQLQLWTDPVDTPSVVLDDRLASLVYRGLREHHVRSLHRAHRLAPGVSAVDGGRCLRVT